MKAFLLDANVLVRFLVQDDPKQRMAARAAQLGLPVASFDRDFDKFKDIKRFEPAA